MKKMAWEDFRASGLLWWVNRSLHLFGWAIVFECAEDGEVVSAYPARVAFRGFTEDDEESGFKKLTAHIADESAALLREVEDD